MLDFIKPEFFDLFGLIVFIYIVILSIEGLIKKRLSKWIFISLLLIGIAGFIVDGTIVYLYYLIK